MRKDKEGKQKPKNVASKRVYDKIKVGQPYGKPSVPVRKIKKAVKAIMQEDDMI